MCPNLKNCLARWFVHLLAANVSFGGQPLLWPDWQLDDDSMQYDGDDDCVDDNERDEYTRHDFEAKSEWAWKAKNFAIPYLLPDVLVQLQQELLNRMDWIL